MREAVNAGFSAHISKPVALDDLLDVQRKLRPGNRRGDTPRSEGSQDGAAVFFCSHWS